MNEPRPLPQSTSVLRILSICGAATLILVLALYAGCNVPSDLDEIFDETAETTALAAANGPESALDSGEADDSTTVRERRSSLVQRDRSRRDRTPRPRRRPDPDRRAARFPEEFRTIDGSGNNLTNPDWGSAGTTFLRLAPAAYADRSETPAGADRPSARAISIIVAAQSESRVNDVGASDYVWQWGQFLDHDIDETPVADPREEFDIQVPADDALFDPTGSGTVVIPLDRSAYTVVAGVREQVNEITAFIDASNVYGSDAERASALRSLDGTGRLRTSAGDLLPFNDVGLENAPSDDAAFFLAGDIRANEQVGLTAMHTLFVREHNHWADEIATAFPDLGGDEIYEHARAIVAAEMQAITYREFLPVLLGPAALPAYRGYRPDVDPGISNEFATAAYRLGHSMLSPTLLRRDENGDPIAAGDLSLADAFFNPQETVEYGIDAVLRGLAAQAAQRVDHLVIDEVRNFLFGPPGAGGFDLPALNIQRGRDHGLPSLNPLRAALGLSPYSMFAEINDSAEVRDRLASAYPSVADIDPWVGGLAEPPASGGLVGETWRVVLRDQFVRLRDGDRFWYQAYLPSEMVQLIERQTLARIIRRNTAIGDELPDNVFLVP